MSEVKDNYFQCITIGNHISELPKSKLPASAAFENGRYPFICSSSELRYTNSYLETKPAVIMGTGGVASVHFGKEQFAYSTDTWAIRSKSYQLDTEFLYRKIQHLLPDIDFRAFEGSGLKHLKKNDVKKLKIGVPLDSNVSKKLLKILRTIDQTIEKTEALIAKYQLIKAGLMQDLFTRGIEADGKLRPTREQAPELYHETKIGWIPKDWVCDEIKNFVTSAQYGVSISLSDEENGIPVLRMNNIKNNKFDVSDLKYSNSVEASTIKIREGDVLYNRTNSMEHVGKTAIWRNELSECSFASYLVRMNLKVDILLPDFFSHWMSQDSSQIALRRYATPAVQQVNINPTNVQKVLIACPKEIAEQQIIFERIDAIDLKIFAEEDMLLKLEKQKQGLMHDLLTGKKRVTVDECEAEHV